MLKFVSPAGSCCCSRCRRTRATAAATPTALFCWVPELLRRVADAHICVFPSKGGRLLLHMALQSEAAAAAASAAAEKRVASKAAPGRIVTGTVTHATPLAADVKLESGALSCTFPLYCVSKGGT